jgi:predicted Zn finger-like uncharacterized protein
MFTEEQKEFIIREYFQTLSPVRCPEDQAFLEIEAMPRIGPSLEMYVFCPLCKARFEFKKETVGQKWKSEHVEGFIKAHLRGQNSECPNCGSLIEVDREQGGYEDKYPYSVKCRYCLLDEYLDF